jgi:hypothetical protein
MTFDRSRLLRGLAVAVVALFLIGGATLAGGNDEKGANEANKGTDEADAAGKGSDDEDGSKSGSGDGGSDSGSDH